MSKFIIVTIVVLFVLVRGIGFGPEEAGAEVKGVLTSAAQEGEQGSEEPVVEPSSAPSDDPYGGSSSDDPIVEPKRVPPSDDPSGSGSEDPPMTDPNDDEDY